jgi:hypothetical protein
VLVRSVAGVILLLLSCWIGFEHWPTTAKPAIRLTGPQPNTPGPVASSTSRSPATTEMTASKKTALALTVPFRILCFGDSLTAGYYQFGRKFSPYGDTLQAKLGFVQKLLLLTRTSATDLSLLACLVFGVHAEPRSSKLTWLGSPAGPLPS